MNAESPLRLPYNGEMLRWAREWRGRSAEEAAQKLSLGPERILAWEGGDPDDVPTVRQARVLADFYGREFLEFFYDAPPEIRESGLIPDFRIDAYAANPHENREILAIQHWAEAQRLNALELFVDIGEDPPAFPTDLIATIDDDAETAAIATRKALSFTIEQQKRMTGDEQRNLPSLLRERMEKAGVLVLRRNDLSEWGVSGFCIAAFPLPIIAYSAESPPRQAFTLIHEFGHVVLRQSAISGTETAREACTYDRKVERWCNRFASAFLIPEAALAELRPRPARPAPQMDDVTLHAVARVFRVSEHAMLIRLVNLGYVEDEYYWTVKLPQFLARERAWKGGGRSAYWASRIVNSLGNLYTGLVLEAWGTGRIPFHHAADYFGLKNPAHLSAIRQEFGGA